MTAALSESLKRKTLCTLRTLLPLHSNHPLPTLPHNLKPGNLKSLIVVPKTCHGLHIPMFSSNYLLHGMLSPFLAWPMADSDTPSCRCLIAFPMCSPSSWKVTVSHGHTLKLTEQEKVKGYFRSWAQKKKVRSEGGKWRN